MNYTALATELEAEFLAAYNVTVEDAERYIARQREINTPLREIKTVEQLITPKLNSDQDHILYLVRELDAADAKRRTQIKRQLKSWYKIDLAARKRAA